MKKILKPQQEINYETIKYAEEDSNLDSSKLCINRLKIVEPGSKSDDAGPNPVPVDGSSEESSLTPNKFSFDYSKRGTARFVRM